VVPSRRRPPCGRAAASYSNRPARGRSPSQPRAPDRHDAAARPAPSGGQPDSAGAGRRPSASVPQGPGCAVEWSVCGLAALEWVGCSGQAASRSMRRGCNGISRRRPAFWRGGRCGFVCSRRRHSPPHRRPFGTGSGCCRRRPPAHPVPSPAQRCGNGHRADLVNLDTGATVYENAAPSQCPEGGSDGFTRRRKQPTADRGHPAGAHQLTAGGRDLAGQAEAHHTSAPASPARQPGPAGRGRPVVGARSRHRPPSPARHPCTGTCRPHRSATRHRRSGRPSSTSRPSPPLASRCGPRATRDHRRRSDHLTSLVAAGSCARWQQIRRSQTRGQPSERGCGACTGPYGRRVALTPGHRRMTCGGLPALVLDGQAPDPREPAVRGVGRACTARPWALAADRQTATRPPICATSNAIFAASSASRTCHREPAAAQRYAALWPAGVGLRHAPPSLAHGW